MADSFVTRVKNRMKEDNEILASVDNTPITITCPSCKGQGRIPREYESQMVALIPASDDRLKPSRTGYYVIITIITCVIIATSTFLLLMPRNLHLSSNIPRYSPDSVIISESNNTINISVMAVYEFRNENYYPAVVQSLKVVVINNQTNLGEATNYTQVTVPMRSTKTQYVRVNITYQNNPEVTGYCVGSIGILIIPFQATATSSSFGHTAECSSTDYPYVDCKRTKTNYLHQNKLLP